MTYKTCLTDAMTRLADDHRTLFVGYNTRYSGQAAGTLANVPVDQLIEMPLAENLMAGAAIGMSLAGFLPVLYFERFDFILNALDALVNHLDKIKPLSAGQFSPACIIRVVVGNTKKPLYTGPTHTQDFTKALRRMVKFPLRTLEKSGDIAQWYDKAMIDLRDNCRTTILVEYKDRYEEQ
jgi:pyruvate/2-oxoglutarate/acetoin dehydrogenase E1 component